MRDCGIDGTEPLLAAAREAILNAARHSGAATRVGVPRGRARAGDDLRARPRARASIPRPVPADRGGISHSIVGRMTRAGGRAAVRSTASEGTEVELVLPLTKVGEPS